MSGDFQDRDSAKATPRSEPPGDREPPSTTVLYAVLGGLIGVLLFVLPLSTALGGAVAGYLDGGRYAAGAKVGGLAGVVAFGPFVVVFGFVFVFLPAITALHLGAQLPVWVRVLVTVSLAAAYTVGLSTSGGVLGIYVRKVI